MNRSAKNEQSHISAHSLCAFTLIELLVVVAIIAILASLLFPALARARDKAYGTIDLNNNKQVMLAMNMYTEDNEQFLPTPGWGTGLPCWLWGPNFPRGGSQASPALVEQQLESVRQGQLWDYVLSEKVYVCPLDAKEQIGLKRNYFNQRVVYVSSYVWNGSIISYGRMRGGQTHKITSYRGVDILQWEADEVNPFFFNDVSSRPDRGISQRHGSHAKHERSDFGGGAHVGTFGGSAQYITYRQFYKLSGPVLESGCSLKNEELPNELWHDPGDPQRGGTCR